MNVGPHIESYAWVSKSVIFAKLREVGVFLLLGLFQSKSHSNGMMCLGLRTVVQFSPKILGLNAGIWRTVLESLELM